MARRLDESTEGAGDERGGVPEPFSGRLRRLRLRARLTQEELSERSGKFSQRVLATHAHVEGATITHHVDQLERLGLVRRQMDPTDRRRYPRLPIEVTGANTLILLASAVTIRLGLRAIQRGEPARLMR